MLASHRSKDEKIALVGFMGVGKSSVARSLASILCCEAADLDEFIEKSEKATISAIIEEKGEAYFRDLERFYLSEILKKEMKILSLGGGTWVFEKNRELIKGFGYTVIWLDSTFEHCWENIKTAAETRPLAKEREKTKKLFLERQRFYCLADFRFYVEAGMTPNEIAEAIIEKLKLSSKNQC